MDFKNCPICGQKILAYETKCLIKRSYLSGYRPLPFKMHYSCLMKMLWQQEGFDVKIEEDDFEYIGVSKRYIKDEGYKNVWKYGTYTLKKHTQEEFDHYKAMHLRNVAKKKLIKK